MLQHELLNTISASIILLAFVCILLHTKAVLKKTRTRG